MASFTVEMAFLALMLVAVGTVPVHGSRRTVHAASVVGVATGSFECSGGTHINDDVEFKGDGKFCCAVEGSGKTYCANTYNEKNDNDGVDAGRGKYFYTFHFDNNSYDVKKCPFPTSVACHVNLSGCDEKEETLYCNDCGKGTYNPQTKTGKIECTFPVS
jgi:hypothetical protein